MILSKSYIEIVMRSKIFKGTAESIMTRMALSTDCEMEQYNKCQIICSPKNYKRSIGIIVDGTARIQKPVADGKRLTLNTLNAGDVFGAAAVFNDTSVYVNEIYALTDCRVIYFSERLILRGIERDSKFAENYVRYLSDRILFLNRKIASLTSGSAEQRLAAFFADNLTDSYSAIPVSMTELSYELNISRASLYRALDSLCDCGAIMKSGKEYKIKDSNTLRKVVNEQV